MSGSLHVWLNVATILCIAGVITFLSCLGSTTFWGDR